MSTRLSGLPLAIALLGLVAGCQREPPKFEVIKNSCLADLNCEGKDVVCDPTALQCVRLKTALPYRVVLQVQAESNSPELMDAGVTLVEQAAFSLTLDGAVAAHVLEVPAALRAYGKVQGEIDGEMTPLESEVTLTPTVGETAIRATVVNTAQGADAGSKQIDVLLNPQLRYDVRVQPLLSASAKLPPLRTTAEYDPHKPLEIEYSAVEAREAKLAALDWAGQQVRLEDKGTGEVVSSVDAVGAAPEAGIADGGVADAGTGSFRLYAAPEVLAEPSKFNLVLGLNHATNVEGAEVTFPRWQVKIALDGTRFLPNSVISMPSVPRSMRYTGKVENGNQQPIPYAELLFTSNFPLPEGADYVGDSDWCRLRPGEAPGQVSCSARLSITADDEGKFVIDLLPGTYRIIVTPTANSREARDRATFMGDKTTIEYEPDGTQGPIIFPAPAATRYIGTVQSPQREGMPNVTINARSLGLEDTRAPEISRYNRSVRTTTDAKGQFAFYIDVGLYDLSIEPPVESGFAWLVCPNYFIRPRDPAPIISLKPLRPAAPVPLSGTVEHAGVPLANARIDAYAELTTEDGTRLVQVARGVSDAQGAYRLLMPPIVPPIQKGTQPDCPPRFE